MDSFNGEGNIRSTLRAGSGFRSRAGLVDGPDLSGYAKLIVQRWPLVCAAAAVAAIATAVAVTLLVTPRYQAQAIIRPVSENGLEQRLTGALGDFEGFGNILGLGSGLLGGGASNQAYEYIPMLQSFAFVHALVEQHHLASRIYKESHSPLWYLFPPKDPDWVVFRTLRHRFECDYSLRESNVELSYLDPDRREAARILGYFIDGLREKLRRQQINDSRQAAASLRVQARTTPDALLAAQLYQLLARQVQREQLAQVQADFAFKVLDPPNVSDRPVRPQVMLDAACAGLLALMLVCGWIVLSSGEAYSFERHYDGAGNGRHRTEAPVSLDHEAGRVA